MQLEQKQTFTKIEVVCQNAKRSFFGMFFFFAFWWFCFLLPVLWFLCFVKKAQKGYFPAILEGFLSILFPQKACLKVFLFFLFCFFCFCLPFQNSILSLCFLAISPFLENINIFGFFLFLFLAFSFLNACLFLSNKLS